jgi:phytoene dehydrogenase-like protein
MTDVLIVGGGLAGLVCAQDLARAGVECSLLEASDVVGGRVRTDRVDGFLLDRGFQIVLCAYPQVQRRFDLPALGLGFFEPGAQVWARGALHPVSDPLRRPLGLPRTLRAPIGTPGDLVRAARLVLDVRRRDARDLLRRPDMSTARRLAELGFSETFVAAFWRPFFAGIQLDPDLEVSSRRFELILKMLAKGATGLPRDGIAAMPRQLAASLPEGTVRLGARVAAVEPGRVTLEDGEVLRARVVVVATEGPEAHRLLPGRVADPGSRPAACCWFAAPAPPLAGPWLLLDGEGDGPARNVVVISEVQSSYAPAGSALIAAAVPGAPALEANLQARVRGQLARVFGAASSDFTHLRTDVIAHGQPDQRPPLSPRQRVEVGEGLFVCGDHRDTASVQGAMFSGERTAAAVLAGLKASDPLR